MKTEGSNMHRLPILVMRRKLWCSVSVTRELFPLQVCSCKHFILHIPAVKSIGQLACLTLLKFLDASLGLFRPSSEIIMSLGRSGTVGGHIIYHRGTSNFVDKSIDLIRKPTKNQGFFSVVPNNTTFTPSI